MGIIKRMLRRTIAKIAPTMSSHELVLNQALDVTGHHHHNQLSTPSTVGHAVKSSSKRSSVLQRKIKKCKSRDLAAAEALLLASKNHLPPVQFHHIHGSNAQLSSNKCVARRTQGFCQSLVFSNRVILPNERVYIKVLDISKVWSGTIRFGFTAVDPATLAVHMPKHACPDMTNAGHTWARALADEVVKRNSVIHFSYNKDGLIYYGINNQDCGIFYANVNSNQNLWFIVDIYGKTTAVELIDPRVHHASSAIDFSQLDDELSIGGGTDRGTMFKCTSTMDDIFGRYGGQSKKRKRSRKLASRRNALLHTQWPLEGALAPDQLGSFRFTHQQLPNQLPNFNSMVVPSAQQNIYSPMPSLQTNTSASGLPRASNDQHDYHQIMNSHQESPYHHQQRHPARVSKLPSSLATHHHNQSPPAGPSSASNASPPNDEQDITRRLSGIQLTEMNSHLGQHQQVSPLSPSSSPAAVFGTTQAPVAAARRRQTSQILSPMQTYSKRSSESKDLARLVAHHIGSGKPNGLSASPSARNTIKPKSRHSNTTTTTTSSATLKSTPATSSTRDSNNNNNDGQPSKDCPICFERPINCVLYQCGHMCTCYECGVKQWKTQSRTCPICRTVIKDVIKTYMS